MSQLASDNFNRANESPLASPWATGLGGGLQIVSNQTQGVTAGSDNLSYYNGGIAWPSDQYSQAKLAGSFDLSNARAVVIRWNGTSGYLLSAGPTTTDSIIYKCVAGTFSALFTIPASTLTWATGDVVSLEGRGAILIARQNGRIIGSKEDFTFLDGFPGLYTQTAPAALNWDDWSAGDFGRTPGALLNQGDPVIIPGYSVE